MNQQGPTVENRELCSMLHGSLIGGGFGEEWRYIYIYMSHFTVRLKLL